MIYVGARKEWILSPFLPPGPPLGTGGQPDVSLSKLLTPTLWHLLELKEVSYETGLTGLKVALTG